MRSMYNNGDYLKNHDDWHLNDSNWKADKIIDILTKYIWFFNSDIKVEIITNIR